jgi:putative two-component system response regulator
MSFLASGTTLRAGTAQTAPRVLIVDDEPTIVHLIARWLTAEGLLCMSATDSATALALLEQQTFDLLISDICLPGTSGMRILETALRRDPHLAVIMITALTDRDTAMEAVRLGAYGYIIKPFECDELLIAMANALERRRLLAVSREYELALEQKVQARTAKIQQREAEITLHLIAAAEYRDDETGTHLRRIGQYTAILARALGWADDAVITLQLAAPMHDIGKIGIPDHILQKPGKLATEEFEIMKTHTKIGAAILGDTEISVLRMGQEVAMMHHERWDGSGYPDGLRGHEIKESARIVALVDVYDALMTDRIYRPAFPEAEALELLKACSATHFDPDIWTCFMDHYAAIHAICCTDAPP